MALPLLAAGAGGFFAWFVGLFSTAFTSFATWLMTRFVFEKAARIALVTAFLVASAGILVTTSVGIKALAISAQYSMPSSLGMFTYFLPENINLIFSLIVTIRVWRITYRWTVQTMSSYLPHNPSTGIYMY